MMNDRIGIMFLPQILNKQQKLFLSMLTILKHIDKKFYLFVMEKFFEWNHDYDNKDTTINILFKGGGTHLSASDVVLAFDNFVWNQICRCSDIEIKCYGDTILSIIYNQKHLFNNYPDNPFVLRIMTDDFKKALIQIQQNKENEEK